MDFTFDDEQLALQEVARGALERECDPADWSELVDEPAGMTPALWSTLVELGWTGLLVPEEYGGTGAGLLEMCIVAEQMGRLPLPGPFFSSAMAATLAARALGATELLGDLAAGARRGTIALQEQGHGDPLGTVRTRARRKGADWVVNGTSPSWSTATPPIGSSSWPAARRACAPTCSSARRRAGPLARPHPQARPPGARRDAGHPARAAGQPRPVAARAGRHCRRLAAETVGAADRALAEAIAYTSERIVFDRPVATYQTVRHRLVEMYQQVEMARAGLQFAAWASDTEAPERAQAAAMAASYAAEAGVRVTGRRHPAPRWGRLHVGQRRPLPLQAGQAERGPDRWRRSERHRLAPLFIESA